MTLRHFRGSLPCFTLWFAVFCAGCSTSGLAPSADTGTITALSIEDSETSVVIADPQRNGAATTSSEIHNTDIDSGIVSVKPEQSEPVEVSSRQLLEQAIEQANNAVRSFKAGNDQGARQSLEQARYLLTQADLPEVFRHRGFSWLSYALDDESAMDLQKLADLLGSSSSADSGVPARTERDWIELELRRILLRFGANDLPEGDFQMLIQEVEKEVAAYRGKHRTFFERSFARKHKYWPTLEAVFTPRNIPLELGYMAFVESGFNPRAHSHAGARGLWQFIPSTGRRYGLHRQDDFYDVEKSTLAAAEYLLDLISLFGSPSFLLSTAAYNAGEGRIQKCLRQLDNPFERRSFLHIRGCLSPETRAYVPKILAAAVISTQPRLFGFELEAEDEVRQRYDIVTISHVTRLSHLAQRGGFQVSDLKEANSDLRSKATVTPGRNFPLYVPVGSGTKLVPHSRREKGLTNSEAQIASTRTPKEQTYRVRKGDTLSTIAKSYGVGYRDIASWNHLRPPYRLSIGQRLKIHSSGVGHQTVYTVQPGNSLQTIANVFSVPHRDIMEWNQLRSSRLKAGQQLIIRLPRPVRKESYRVKRGDTAARIARRFGVEVQDVLTVNGLKTKSVIHPGQRLVIYVG